MRQVTIELKQQNIFLLVDEEDYVFKYTLTTKAGKVILASYDDVNIRLTNVNKIDIQNIIDKYWGDGFYALTQYFKSKNE